MADSYSKHRAAAFVEYCKGQTLEEISFGLALPLNILKGWYRMEQWSTVSKAALVPVISNPEQAKRDLAAIEANRQVNLNIAKRLQNVLLDTVTKLEQGELTITRVTAKGLTVESPPTPRDVADIANTARAVADMSYRALGDVIEVKHSGSERPGDNQGAGQITIVMPALVALPRQKRAEMTLNVEAQAVTELLPASASSQTECPSEPGGGASGCESAG